MLRIVPGCVLGLLLCAGPSSADDKKGGDTIDAKKLVGKWSPKGEKEGAVVIEFTKDGKVKVTAGGDGKEFKLEGTYKVGGNKVTTTMCREAKALAPPATAWARGDAGAASRLGETAAMAVRAPDPFYRADGAWVVRRLAPHCSRIGLDGLGRADAGRVLSAMGAEVANVHLGTPGAGAEVLKDLARRKEGWLEAAARAMTDATDKDWAAWKAARPGRG